MIDSNEFLIHARVNAEVLEAGVEAGWLVPIDQVHGLRRTLRELLAAISQEPETTRHRIVTTVRERRP
jgi:hypothetical protein